MGNREYGNKYNTIKRERHMSYRLTYRVTSRTNPSKVYTSTAEFWEDHETETSATDTQNTAYAIDGDIEATTSTLSGDGSYVTYVKTYKDRGAFTQYASETSSGLTAEAVVLNFQRTNEEEI